MYFTIEPASGGYRAYIKGGNHEIVFWSEVYTTRTGAERAIALVKANAATAPTR